MSVDEVSYSKPFNPSELTVVIADDNPDLLFALEQLLLDEGFTVHCAENGKRAFEVAQKEIPDLIILDVVMPEMDGLEATRAIKAHPTLCYVPVLLVTSKDDLEDIVKGLSAGADDYLSKPFKKEELVARLMAANRTRDLYQDLLESQSINEALKDQIATKFAFNKIIGQSDVMNQVYSLIEKVARTSAPVLVSGESGTGKELVAHAIHQQSNRSAKRFVVVNCAAFSEHLLESELFGHVKGAFTGAIKDKPGLFEVADGGSFFLDELGEMSLALQVKLLRVLQDGSFSPVGSTDTKKVDVRIIAATNRNLEQMIVEGAFREDLYYRLNVVPIALPPLRERPTDIPLLVENFLELAVRKNDFPRKQISTSVMRALTGFAWPGNVRQLQNEVERMVILSGDGELIDESVLSPGIVSAAPHSSVMVPQNGATLKDATEALERQMIAAALAETGHNKSEAARILGVSRSSLITKVQGYGLE
ncbi:MAG: sigma-54-dependent Fis family transcriptional regulator [Bdellovibrionales bacterium]|nr:sigma-54-dependent Fis family transcriptional regulator [Bdellovibrionales bacterium]